MMDQEHLHLLINEEIYAIGKEAKVSPDESQETISDVAPKKDKEIKRGHIEETPSIPVAMEESTEKVIPIAIFHESSSESDLELLQKIIGACKLSPEQYQVFASGFNKKVQFKKALVFVASAKKFYESVLYQDGQILCSKPLSEIANNQQEKAKLWGALKVFL